MEPLSIRLCSTLCVLSSMDCARDMTHHIPVTANAIADFERSPDIEEDTVIHARRLSPASRDLAWQEAVHKRRRHAGLRNSFGARRDSVLASQPF